jgi:hypothetical protein
VTYLDNRPDNSAEAQGSAIFSNIFFFIFVLLAFFQFPVFAVSDRSVGLFDFATVFALLFFCIPDILKFIRGKFAIDYHQFIIICTYLIFICYLAVHVLFQPHAFSVGLFFKQIQYGFIFWIATILIQRIGSSKAKLTVNICLGLAASYGLFNFLYLRNSTQLGLPFKEGLGPNPAAFVFYTGFLTLVLSKDIYSHPLLKWPPLLLALSAGVFTFSRTNQLCLIIAGGLGVFLKYKKVFFLVSIVFFCAIYAVYDLKLFGVHIYGKNPFNYFSLEALLNDDSLNNRIVSVWFRHFELWSSSWSTIFFGNGFGHERIYDSLYASLLQNIGLVGFIIYGIFLGQLFYFSAPVRILVLYALINGITAETTINVFRAMHVFVIYLALLMRDQDPDYSEESKLNYKIRIS